MFVVIQRAPCQAIVLMAIIPVAVRGIAAIQQAVVYRKLFMFNKKQFLIFICCLLSVGLIFLAWLWPATEVKAGSSQNVTGFAWSENIGWVSMNSLNCDANNDGLSDGSPAGCPPSGAISNYGVNIGIDGNFTGFAWSENIGWIQFDPVGPYPASPNYSAQMDTVTGALSGWARALSYGGGWDGWIKLSNVSINTANGNFAGFAWGSDVMGWLSFAGSNYNTRTTFGFNAIPAVGNLAVNQGDYCVYPLHPILSWVFSDADSGDYQDSYNVQIDDDSNVADAPLGDSCLPSPGTCSAGHGASSYTPLISFAYNATYYWRVKVADNRGAWSAFSGNNSFTTPSHAFPNPDFTTASKTNKGEFIQFCATAQVGVCNSDVSLCYNTAGQTISCSGKTFLWAFPLGAQFSTTTSPTSENPKVKIASAGPQTISLTITDEVGACSVSKTVNVSQALPKWRETPP